MKPHLTRKGCAIAATICAAVVSAQEEPPIPKPPLEEVFHEARANLKVEIPIGWEVVLDKPKQLRMNLVPQRGTFVLVEIGLRADPAVLEKRLTAAAKRAEVYKNAGRLTSWEELALGDARVIFTVEADTGKSRKNQRIICRGYAGDRSITITGSTYTQNFRLVQGLLEQVIRSMKWQGAVAR